MLASFDSSGNFVSSIRKEIAKATEEAEKYFDAIQQKPEAKLWNTKELTDFAKELKVTNKDLLKFLADEKYKIKDLATFNQYLKEQAKSLDLAAAKTRALTLAKNVLLNIGIALAASFATKVVSQFFDNLYTSVKEQDEVVSNLQSEYDSLNSEIDELTSKESLTESEKVRLQYLEKQAEAVKKRLEYEKEAQIVAQVGNGIGADWDTGTLQGKYYRDFGLVNSVVSGDAFNKMKANSTIDFFNRLDAGTVNVGEGYIEKQKEQLDDLYSWAIEKEADYREALAQGNDLLASGILSNEQQEEVKGYIAGYEEGLANLIEIQELWQKQNAKFDPFTSVSDHTNFDEVKDQLIELGQTGELTAEKIEKIAPGLLDWFSGEDITNDQVINWLIELGNVAEETAEKLDGISDTGSFNIADKKDAIDEVQTSVTNLRSALEKLYSGNLSVSEVIDLMQEFPELAPYIDLAAENFGDLANGLHNLIAESPKELISDLEELKGTLQTDEEIQKVNELIDALQRLSSYGDTGTEAYDTAIGNTWEDTSNIITKVTSDFENLAKVQEAVANGFTISAAAAAELAQMYPEILNQATATADGQIALNADVVNGILQGDHSIIEGQIAKLEADKAVLTAKKTFAEAELQILQSAAEGKGALTKQEAIYQIETAQKVAQQLIDSGMAEDEAYMLVAQNMSGNLEQFGQVAGTVSENTEGNLINAGSGAAQNLSENSTKMQTSLINVGLAAANAALAVSGISKGKVLGNLINRGGGGSASGTKKKATVTKDGFSGVPLDEIKLDKQIDDLILNLQTDISGYDAAISNINGQIDVLKNLQGSLQNRLKTTGSGSGSSGSSGSGSSGSDNEVSETYDWIEVAISRVQKAIETLGRVASNTYKKWTTRNQALSEELDKTREQIKLQQEAYATYMAIANAGGLSDYYKNLVKNGTLQIETITDEDLIDQIEYYQTWYDKAIECQEAIQDLEIELGDLASTKFDNLVSEYDDALSFIEHRAAMIEADLDKAAAQGYLASANYYKALTEVENENLAKLKEERDVLISAMGAAMADGQIEEDSAQWSEMQSSINEVTEAIKESELALIEYSNELRNLEWEVFDRIQDSISSITDETEFLLNLMENDKMFADGNFTNEGLASLGLRAVNYQTYMEQAQKYAEEIQKIEKDMANDPYNTELIDRREELLELQRESILAAEDEKEAIRDLVEEGYDAFLDALSETIDTYKDLMSEWQDSYDFQKEVAEQTKQIQSLEKQLAAYSGDTSESGMLKTQETQNALNEARQQLQETQQDKFISETEKILDNLYSEAESVLNERLDNIDQLLIDVFNAINENSGTIGDTLTQVASDSSTALSDTMNEIWAGGDGIQNTLAMYGEKIGTVPNNVSSAIENIETYVKELVNAANKEAEDALEANRETEKETTVTAPSGGASASGGSTSTGTAGSSGSTGTSGLTGSPGSSTSSGSFFISKKDNYPKSSLQKEMSIVDRLKYRDFDSSFAARAKYYSAMGFSGEYLGTSAQNQQMLTWMKNNGFRKGAYNISGSRLAMTNEDRKAESILDPNNGLMTVIPNGGSVLNSDMTRNFWDFAEDPSNYITKNLPSISKGASGSIENHVDLSVTLPNVTNYDEFCRELQKDPRFEKLVKAITVDQLNGASSRSKYRINF